MGPFLVFVKGKVLYRYKKLANMFHGVNILGACQGGCIWIVVGLKCRAGVCLYVLACALR